MKVWDFVEAKLNTKVKRRVVDSDALAEMLSDPSFEGSVLGSGSLYNPKQQTVYVLQSELLQGKPITAPAIARAILENSLKSIGRKRYPKPKDWENWELTTHPLYADPGEGQFIYLDIVGAFFQIYSKLPLIPGGSAQRINCAPPWLSPQLPEDLNEWKLVRNCLVGCWRGDKVTRIKNGGLTRTPQYLPTTNYYGWEFVQKVLHYLGYVALQYGACYVYSDGFIFPLSSNWQGFRQELASLGFPTKEKARGFGEINAVGSYAVGQLITKRACQTRAYDNIIRSSEVKNDLEKLQRFNPYYWRSYESIQ